MDLVPAPAADSPSSLWLLGLALSCVAEKTNLNNHDNALQMRFAHLCVA